MGVLRVDHPDIVEFIRAKGDEKTLQNFNLSVAVTDAFLEAARDNQRYDLVDPRTGKHVGTLQAKKVFQMIVEAAWQTGDPGLLFLDAINRVNPTPHLGRLEATNPCGEIPLLPHESCNLGSINLVQVVSEDNGSVAVDWGKLRVIVQRAVRFLDDVIEVNRFPIPKIGNMARGNRKIGLGVMGFAELLIRLGVSYASDLAVQCADQLMRFIAEEAFKTSQELAEERGVFPNWKGSVFEAQALKVRNATCTAVAPTGTVSIIAGTSPSIEPLFALAYRRSHVLSGQTLYEVNPLFVAYAQRHGLSAAEPYHSSVGERTSQNDSGRARGNSAAVCNSSRDSARAASQNPGSLPAPN
jgi:ribonucleoside-diphosphate reductase alpha chain